MLEQLLPNVLLVVLSLRRGLRQEIGVTHLAE